MLYSLDDLNWGINVQQQHEKRKKKGLKHKSVSEFYQPSRKRVRFNDVDKTNGGEQIEIQEVVDKFENALDTGTFDEFWNVAANQKYLNSVLDKSNDNHQQEKQTSSKIVNYEEKSNTKSTASNLVEKIRNIRKAKKFFVVFFL